MKSSRQYLKWKSINNDDITSHQQVKWHPVQIRRSHACCKNIYLGPMKITQLIGQCIVIYRGRDSNPKHLIYSSYKVNFNH